MNLSAYRALRSRRDRRHEHPRIVAAGGIAVLLVIGLLVYITIRASDSLPLQDHETVFVDVPNPGNLAAHNEVRIAGERVGQVLGIEARRGRARIELQLDSGILPMPADTRALVRAKGLLGARFVELRPGDAPLSLEDGATIRVGPKALTFGVPEALETFDRETRGDLGEMLGQFGTGLLGRGRVLNHAIGVSDEGSRDFRALADEILARAGAARRFVPSLEQAAVAFDDSREELARSLAPTARGLEPFVDRRDAVHALLEEAPPALSEVDSGLEAGRRLLGSVRELSAATSDTLPAAPAGLRALTALLRDSRTPLRRGSKLLEDLRPTVPDLLLITDRLAPNLGPLRRAFSDLGQLVAGAAPYTCDIENFAENFRSMLGFDQGPGGEIGPLNGFRASAVGGPEAFGSFGGPAATESLIYAPYEEPCARAPGPVYELTDSGVGGAP